MSAEQVTLKINQYTSKMTMEAMEEEDYEEEEDYSSEEKDEMRSNFPSINEEDDYDYMPFNHHANNDKNIFEDYAEKGWNQNEIVDELTLQL